MGRITATTPFFYCGRSATAGFGQRFGRVNSAQAYNAVKRSTDVVYLAEAAVLSRLVIGAVRAWQVNSPSEKKLLPNQTLEDRWRIFWERNFVELLGVALQFATMEGVRTLAERQLLKHHAGRYLPQFDGLKQWHVTDDVIKALEAHWDYVCTHVMWEKAGSTMVQIKRAEPLNGAIRMFEEGNPAEKIHGAVTILKNAGRELNGLEIQHVLQQSRRFLRLSYSIAWLSTAAGILAGAVVSGPVLQWLNDRIVAPHVIPVLNRWAQVPQKEQARLKKLSDLWVQGQLNTPVPAASASSLYPNTMAVGHYYQL